MDKFFECLGSPCLQCFTYQSELASTNRRCITLESQMATQQAELAQIRQELLAKEMDLRRAREKMFRVGSLAGSLLEMCSDFDKVWMLHSKKVYSHIQALLTTVE